jgi:V8-like Glu-specific endopeptidase
MTLARNALILTLALGCADVRAEGEQLGSQSGAILNGHPAKGREQWGTVGMILGDAEDEWLCTGTLIAPDVLVTAAHCVIDPESGARAKRMTVVAGAPDIDEPDASQVYEVERVFPHPKAFQGEQSDDATGLGGDYDLALVKTTERITQVDVMPILPAKHLDEALYVGGELTIAGYGRRVVNQFGVSSEDGLHYVGAMHFVRRSEREFLAGSDMDSDACPGDSGGPVYVELDGKTWLVGATSRGRDDYETWDCGKGGIYTLLSSYQDWILEHTDESDLSEDAWEPESTGPGSEHGDGLRSAEQQVNCSARPSGRHLGPAAWLLLGLTLLASLRFRQRAARARRASQLTGHQALPVTFYSARGPRSHD